MTGMTLIERIRHDPQRRTLTVLGAAALLFVMTRGGGAVAARLGIRAEIRAHANCSRASIRTR